MYDPIKEQFDDMQRKYDRLLQFATDMAQFKLYGAEMSLDGDDAMECFNDMVERARDLTGAKPERDEGDDDLTDPPAVETDPNAGVLDAESEKTGASD